MSITIPYPVSALKDGKLLCLDNWGHFSRETIDSQVVSVLMNLKPPQNWRKGISEAMNDMLGERNLDEHIQEIKASIKRMDTRWDHGFIMNKDEYTQQRIKLQIELEQLTPVADDELEQAADMLENFESHWNRLKGDEEGRHELTMLIVERAYVKDDRLVTMTLQSNYHLVLNHNTNGSTEFSVDPLKSLGGSDETCSLTCINLDIAFLPNIIVKNYLLESIPSTNVLPYI